MDLFLILRVEEEVPDEVLEVLVCKSPSTLWIFLLLPSRTPSTVLLTKFPKVLVKSFLPRVSKTLTLSIPSSLYSLMCWCSTLESRFKEKRLRFGGDIMGGGRLKRLNDVKPSDELRRRRGAELPQLGNPVGYWGSSTRKLPSGFGVVARESRLGDRAEQTNIPSSRGTGKSRIFALQLKHLGFAHRYRDLKPTATTNWGFCHICSKSLYQMGVHVVY